MTDMTHIGKLLGESWIAPVEDMGEAVIYFEKEIEVNEAVESATLYVCGIGNHYVEMNGKAISDHILAPAISGYDERCYYEAIDVTDKLICGKNALEIQVGQGWRRNLGDYTKHFGSRKITFFGIPQLTAYLEVTYKSRKNLTVITDESWTSRGGNITESNLFNGETYDARVEAVSGVKCKKVHAPGENVKMCLQELEPIRIKKIYEPISMHKAKDGYVFDLGQNIAGLAELDIPEGLPEGTVLTLTFSELLDREGDLFTAPLRGAKSTDRYIVGKNGLKSWMPKFTYHGFRYIKLCGLPFAPNKSIIRGVQFYTDIDSGSTFRCGNALVNEIHRMVVITERDNLHSIATDCPQRDERCGWMNDATVRFEEMPYNFNAENLFPKIVRDLCDTQKDGAITDTAPYLFGSRPADPVSSSFLIAAEMSYLHYGNVELIKEAYDNFVAWNDYLASRCKDGIVDYSYWGDWAGPEDCCWGPERPESGVTPGIFMSTGYHFYNAKLLAKFAEILGKDNDRDAHLARAEYVRGAMLDKWFTEDGKFATGSQACQALGLRFGIIPEDKRVAAAKIMNDAVVDAGMRITTGNLCSLYLMEMLAEYGYIDTAWELITKEDYPSIGFMIANGATTIWERMELKKNPSMNSHCHPMYGAIGKWFYSHLAGVTPKAAGFTKAQIKPNLPEKLLYTEANVVTKLGDLKVRWEKNYGETRLLTAIPKGMTATVSFGDKTEEVGEGTHLFYL